MRITRLELADYRNYEALDLEVSPSLTVLVGPNAAGKTNVVEALRLLTATTALRPCHWDELVRWEAETGRARLHAAQGRRRLEIEMTAGADGRRSWKVNGQARRGAAEVAGLLPSVCFTPDDLDLAKGPGEKRRSAIDDVGSQLSPVYGSLRRDYARAVRQRNLLLRDAAAERELAPWSEQVCVLGGRLLEHRLRLLKRVASAAAERYAALSGGEALDWRYDDRSGLGGLAREGEPRAAETARLMSAEMERRAPEERRRGVGLVGPHRDDVVFTIGRREARAFASQGQQRSVALAWKLAEVAVVEQVKRVKPVLLLDDVMSELDGDRREALGRLVTSEVQTVVTTTNLGYFSDELLAGATVVEVGR